MTNVKNLDSNRIPGVLFRSLRALFALIVFGSIVILSVSPSAAGFWDLWWKNYTTYSQVPIRLEPFLNSNDPGLNEFPSNLYDYVQSGVLELYNKLEGKAKFKPLKYDGEFLFPYKDCSQRIDNFYRDLIKGQQPFIAKISEEQGVDFIFMWKPNVRIHESNEEVELTLYIYYPEPNILVPSTLRVTYVDGDAMKRKVSSEIVKAEGQCLY